jgi:hypothetical protein
VFYSSVIGFRVSSGGAEVTTRGLISILMVYAFFVVLICNPYCWICISNVNVVWVCQLDCPTCLA